MTAVNLRPEMMAVIFQLCCSHVQFPFLMSWLTSSRVMYRPGCLSRCLKWSLSVYFVGFLGGCGGCFCCGCFIAIYLLVYCMCGCGFYVLI